MPTRLSEILGVSRYVLEEKGIYDTMPDFDSLLHIDPALLSRCTIQEFRQASGKIQTYFLNVLRLIKAIQKKDDAFYRTAWKLLTFGEGLNTGLGYSSTGTAGSGIGPKMAQKILETVIEVVQAGTSDPTIFELVPIFEEKIGPDRISDMISIILKDEFDQFRARMINELNVNPPIDSEGKALYFVPKTLLSNLPTANKWDDISIAAEYNEDVRDSINSLIGKSWKQTAREINKQELKELLVKYPKLLQELLGLYKSRRAKEYDFVIDHLGILLWDVVGPAAADAEVLNLSAFSSISSENILELVMKISQQFKKLIENNGLVEHLYDSTGKRRPERFPQLLFFSIADSYCQANNIDLNREINAGSGALDFKMSRGLAKVNLEIKYSSNPKLVEGYEKQLPAYNLAEGVQDSFSIYLVLRVNDKNDHKLKYISDIVQDRQKQNLESPLFLTINAIIQPSASKR
jgi:hypothetical protein